MNSEPLPGTHFEAFIFSLKAATSAVCAFLLFYTLGWQGGAWAAVSAVLVCQPSLHPSIQAALTRIVANLIGALGAVLLCALFGHGVAALALGVLFTGMACHFLRLENALRSAYVAVVIVILTTDTHTWHSSLDRVFAVVMGCLTAVVVGRCMDGISRLFNPHHPFPNPTAPNHQETTE